MTCRLLLLAAIIALGSCSRPITRAGLGVSGSALPNKIGSGTNFIGSGEIYFSSKGNRQQAQFDAQWDEAGTLSSTFYDPFGGVAASIMVTPAKATIEVDGEKHTLDGNDNLHLAGMFSGHTFTFRELVRILTGKAPRSEVPTGEPDSTWSDGKLVMNLYKGDSTEVITVKQGASGPVISTIHHPRRASWSVEYSLFKESFPYRIRVTTLPAGDEFTVLFKRIRTLE